MCQYLADNYFDQILPSFIKVRKMLKENSQFFELDMKSENPNFGKKNSFKKGQIRQVIQKVWLPIVAITICFFTLVCGPICILCSRSAKGKDDVLEGKKDN